MTQFITFSRTIVRLVAIVTLLGAVAGANSTAAGINQKGLAVNLTFENLVGEQPNFDVQGFAVGSDGGLVADVIVTFRVAGQEVGINEFMLPVLQVSGGCDSLRIEIAGINVDVSGNQFAFDRATLDLYAGDGTPKPVQTLLCTAGHLADAGASAKPLAGALNRILPAIL
jgi:hypothetical protein